MAKCIFHPNIQGYSGEIINKIHGFRTRMKHAGGQTVGGTVKPKGVHRYTVDPITGMPQINEKKYNLQHAWLLVASVYWPAVAGNAIAFATWDQEAQLLTVSLDYNISPYQLFVGYFIEKYALELGTLVYPTQLSAGASLNYADRASRVWS